MTRRSLSDVEAAGVALALAVVCGVALRSPTGSPGAVLEAAMLASTTTLVLSPVVHPW